MNPYLDADFRVNDVWFSRADAFLLGASSYDAMRAVWPKVTDLDNCVAAALNGRQTIPRVCARRFKTRCRIRRLRKQDKYGQVTDSL